MITNDGDARGEVTEKLDPFGERGECTRGGEGALSPFQWI